MTMMVTTTMIMMINTITMMVAADGAITVFVGAVSVVSGRVSVSVLPFLKVVVGTFTSASEVVGDSRMLSDGQVRLSS